MVTKKFQLLNKNWQFKKADESKWFSAIVPGCIHLDLFRNDLIVDPFFRDNEEKIQWIMDGEWIYQLKFELEKEILDKKYKMISFEGIDTYADVFLNGSKIISSNNMFHPWEVEVSNLLHSGTNQLEVCFRSPIKEVLSAMNQKSYKLPADNDQAGKTSPYTRKAPYHYGWDWGPCFVTSGIWKDVKLYGWDSWYVQHSSILNMKVRSHSAQLTLELELFSEINEDATIIIEEPKSKTFLKN